MYRSPTTNEEATRRGLRLYGEGGSTSRHPAQAQHVRQAGLDPRDSPAATLEYQAMPLGTEELPFLT